MGEIPTEQHSNNWGKSGLLIGWGFRVIAFSALSDVVLKCYVDAQLILVYLI